MLHVLSNYPLSLPYRSALEQKLGATPQYHTVSELRQGSVAALFRRLLSIRGDDLHVAIEDESSHALMPIMSMLAAVTRVRRLHATDEAQQSRTLRRVLALKSGLRLIRESLLAAWSLRRARRSMGKLLASERVEAIEGSGRRVAYLNCNLWFGVKAGGSVGHISGVVNALSDLGHTVDFCTAGGQLLVDDRARTVQLIAPPVLALPFEATYYRFDALCGRQIADHIKANKPDFIYQRMSLGNYTGVRLSRELCVPLILEYNGSEAWIAKNWGRPLRYHKEAVLAEDVCLRHAHVVVTVSEALAKELETRGVERERIVMYPNCIDPSMFNPDAYSQSDVASLRAQLGFTANDVVATFVGTFGQWHGVDVLAKAIREMIDSKRSMIERHRLRFLLIGDGQKMALVREILGTAVDGPYVKLTGLVPQNEAPRYLAASDILLSPHIKNPDGTAFFGSPTKLFEYLAMGRGIVASDLDQLGDVLNPALRLAGSECPTTVSDQVAVLVRPGDVVGLVRGIEFLATHDLLRERLGENARKVALGKYTWRHHVQAILAGLVKAARVKA